MRLRNHTTAAGGTRVGSVWHPELMSTTDRRASIELFRMPQVRDYGAPGWYERLPRGVGTGGILVLLLAISAVLRGHFISGQLWSDEATSVGIASHSLGQIPGVLWQGGGAPLYYVLLHLWIGTFGNSEAGVHALGVVIGTATVPLAMWLGWSLYGRRAGLMLALLFAFNPWLTTYAEEARPYELLAFVALLSSGAFLHVFVLRHRAWLPVFALSLALLVYTDAWGFFLWAGAAIGLVPLLWRSDDRGALARDALIGFLGGFVLFVPWLPTLIHQASSATDPWHYITAIGMDFPRAIVFSDRALAVLVLAVVAGFVPLFTGPERRGPLAMGAWSMAFVAVGGILVALVASIFVPTLAVRYLAPLVAPVLIIAAIGCARSGIVGLVLLIVSCSFLANPASFIPRNRSDMRDVAAEIYPQIRRHDLVLVAQPEMAPLAWYYLPAGLRFATTLGPDPHPTYMNWDDAQARLTAANPRVTLERLVASLAPGQRLVYIRPLTEGAKEWALPWSRLVRRRAAQWGGLLATDSQLVPLRGFFAPHFYRGAFYTAANAVIFVKR